MLFKSKTCYSRKMFHPPVTVDQPLHFHQSMDVEHITKGSEVVGPQ